MSIAVQADGKILVGGCFSGANSIGGQTRNRIARLDPATGLADSFNPNANDVVYFHRGAGGRQDFGRRRFQRRTASADRRATASPGSMPRPGWLIRSNPNANSDVSIQSRCRRTARFWRAAISPSIGGQTRNRIARLDAATGLADSFDPNANSTVLFNRGAGGRQDFSGRRFHHARAERRSDGDAQQHRPAGNRRPARPDARSQPGRQSVFSPPPSSRMARFLSAAILPHVLGVARNNIARLNTDGTLDTAFNPNAQR